jgi:hypothetical protein
VYRGKVTGIMEFGCFVELTGFGHLGKKVRVASWYRWAYGSTAWGRKHAPSALCMWRSGDGH